MNEAITIDARAALLDRADQYASNEPGFARFLRATTEAAGRDDLRAHSADVLEALWRDSYDRLGKRGYAAHEVYLLPPLDLRHPEVIEVFSADMPFIVDSVMAAIREKGGSIRFMTHPILIFDPATFRVLEQPASGTRNESFLHIHIDPLPGEEARDAMRREVDEVMVEVARATSAWRPMLERVQQVIQDWHDAPPKAPPAAVAEAMHFLSWLAEHNFTFLGMREYRLERGSDGEPTLVPLPDTGLGILADRHFRFLRSGADYVEMSARHLDFLTGPEPLMVTKANRRSRVHRRSHLDYVGVKLFDAEGAPRGELRLVGLFTTASLAERHWDVPLIRRKLAEVLRRAGLASDSHAGKNLRDALEAYPRDELFQIDVDQLNEFATTMASLSDRPRVRVLSRIDRFDNFVSILVFVPRDRYDSEVRSRIGAHLADAYDGRISAYYPHFGEGDLVRVHFIVGRIGGPTPRPRRDELEEEITELTLTFGDRLRRAALEPERIAHYLDAFSEDYQRNNTPEDALADIEILEGLADEGALALRLATGPDGGLQLKVFHRGTLVALSDRVPMLDDFGYHAVDERTYAMHPAGAPAGFIHDMRITAPPGALPLEGDSDLVLRIENAILAVWRGEAESDGLNRLTITAGLGWYDVEILRALTRYMKLVGIQFSRSYLISVLSGHTEFGAALVKLFHALNDPGFAGHRERATQLARDTLAAALEATTSLDEDRILRRYLNLVEAVVRTNAYQRDTAGDRRPALALKFDCARVDALPDPRPAREVFVYAPRLEGVHMRFGAIARGGIRWSDRPEDFRTEVLGLVKAQRVKNAIIVPVGAKGAFVPRRPPQGEDRAAIQAEAKACYSIFVSSLLDITDNLNGDLVEPPPDVRRRDGDDPYLVVAADKGTASFSDAANAIALERGYWLGDAFASGGSTGYDHKKMGITARGAWESVKRHFRELGRDIQTEPFTVAGVGDMSGDVFGNGMLLSPQIRLVAAFDHRDIFIDPQPDPVRSLTERARLFMRPASSWQDYESAAISKGGGVYSRALKSVPLQPEARRALGLSETDELTPADVVSAILRADVDLLWFGGIGTYVRASAETDAEVGDRANDAVRIDATELRATVVGEGANLAITQRARIEYALAGGRINTDAIDNSAGVNSSDLEVNIKIALNSEVRAGELSEEARNRLLVEMTDEVAQLCLRNNYQQALALSVAEFEGMAEFPNAVGLIGELEERGLLKRRVEFLPTDAALAERAQAGRPLTRPELAVLLAYAKNATYTDLLDSPAIEDVYLGRELNRYFPERLIEAHQNSVATHRLRREVIATALANAMLNRGGPTFVHAVTAATSANAGKVAAAYAAARDVFDLQAVTAAIEALDNKVPGLTQSRLHAELAGMLRRQTIWFLRNASFSQGLQVLVDRYRAGVDEVRAALYRLEPAIVAQALEDKTDALVAAGSPYDTARMMAGLSQLAMAPDIILLARRAVVDVERATEAFYAVLERFGLGGVIEAAENIVLADRYDRMALDRALANLKRALRDMTVRVLSSGHGDVRGRLAVWEDLHAEEVADAAGAVADLTGGEITVSRLAVAAGLLADLVREA